MNSNNPATGLHLLVPYTILALSVACSIIIAPVAIDIFREATFGRIAAVQSIVLTALANVALLIGIIELIRGRRLYLRPAHLAILGYAAVSATVNLLILPTNIGESSRWFYSSVALPSLALSLPIIIRRLRIRLWIVVSTLVLGVSAILLMLFTSPSGHFPSVSGILQSREQVYLLGTSHGPTTLASISALCVLLLVALWLSSSRSAASNTLISLMIFIAFLGLIASQGRMGLIATLLGLACIAVLYALKHPGKILIGGRILVIILIAVLAIGAASALVGDDVFARLARLPSVLQNPSTDRSLSIRLQTWRTGLQIAKDNPYGVGFGFFKFRTGLTAHNEYLSIALGAGLPGLILFLIAWFDLFVACLSNFLWDPRFQLRTLALLGVGAWIIGTLVGLTEAWSFSNSFFATMVWGVVGIGSAGASHFQFMNFKLHRLV